MMKYNLERQSRIVAALRVPLMLLIVLIHIPLAEEASIRLLPLIAELSNGGNIWRFVYHYISKFLSFSLGHAIVPVFFLFSGYYMFFKYKDWWRLDVYKREMGKRVYTLLIPYLIWSILPLLLDLVRTYLLHRFLGGAGLELQSVDAYLVSALWENNYNFPLWYLRDLIIFNALAPLIYILARRAPWLLVPLFYAYINSMDLLLASRGIFFFFLGAVLGMRRIDMVSSVLPYKYVVYVLFVVSSILIPFADDTLYPIQLKYSYVLVAIATFFCFGAWIDERNPALIDKLGGLSTLVFFVYVSHEVQILSIVKGVFYDYGLLNTIPGYFASAALVVAICVALYYIANRFFPKQLAFVLGRE